MTTTITTPSAQAHEDYTGYVIRYGADEAARILESYREMMAPRILHMDSADAEWERAYIDAAAAIIASHSTPAETAQAAPAAPQADAITAAMVGAIAAPASAHTVTVSWANGTRATYSASMLDLLRTDPAALDIQDDDTGELVYIKPDTVITKAAPQAAEAVTTNEQKEEENTMSNTATKPTATPEAAAILAINPAIFKGLHIKLGFDFQQPVTIRRIPAPFTIKKAWKQIEAEHTPATSTAAIILRDTGNTWGIYRDLHMAPITADNLRDDYDDHMSYSLGRAHGYKTVFSTFYAKISFHDLRKSPTCEAYIIAQRNDLLKPWTEPARDWTERQLDMTPGEHPQPCSIYYANRRPVYLIDKSNYRVDLRREDLKRRAAKLRADRQKAAADAATIATAARRYNDLLKAFNAAKQRIITALVNVDPLTLSPTTVDELETIGKGIGEYAWKGLIGAAREINRFEAAASDNKFTTPAKYDSAYNAILEKLAAILPDTDAADGISA